MPTACAARAATGVTAPLAFALALAVTAAPARAQSDAPTSADAILMTSWCRPADDAWTALDVRGPLPSTITFQRVTADATDVAALTTQVFAVSVGANQFPAPAARTAQRLVLSALGSDTRAHPLTVRAFLAMTPFADAADARGSQRGAECFATDAASPSVQLVLPAGFQGFVEVTRQDVPDAELHVAARLESESLRGSDTLPVDGRPPDDSWFVGSFVRGHALRATLAAPRYQDLVALARCDYLAPAERAPGGCASDHTSRVATLYDWVSEIVGRSAPLEFGSHSGTKTEPIIVFFGLANLNRTVLLDCRDISGRTCEEYSEPWQTSLQRADYAWAVYLEETATGYDTAIDIEFRQRASDFDYEEFDPRAPVQLSTVDAAGSTRRTIRVGYRRFRIREAPASVQVAFTRQGPSYGLRQYQRLYLKRSSRAFALAGTLMVSAEAVQLTDINVREEPRADYTTPIAGRLTTSIAESWVFTGISFRWPVARARASDQPNWPQRLAWSAVPDVTAAIGFREGRNPFFVGTSWPIFSRINLTFGTALFRHDRFRPGYVASQLVPLDRPRDDFIETYWSMEMLLGLAVDIFDSR
jgi:hypothetical protein